MQIKKISSLSLIIPVYNELNNVRIVCGDAITVLTGLTHNWEIILIDDGSDGETTDILKEIKYSNQNIRVLKHKKNEGFGSALITGLSNARYDYLAFLPADGQYMPGILKKLIPYLEEHDIILTTYNKRVDGIIRKLLSYSQNLLSKIIVGDFGFKHGIARIFKKEILDSVFVELKSNYVPQEIAIKSIIQGKRWKEIQVPLKKRISGESKVVGIKKILQVFLELIALRKSLKSKSDKSGFKYKSNYYEIT